MKNIEILVVEDEKPIADTILYALGVENYSTTWCITGHDALKKVEEGTTSLIVLDVGLPDINGFDLCRQIRAFSSVPILFLTARSEEIDRIVGLEIGGDDYMAKPFSPREMTARIRAILRRVSPEALIKPSAIQESEPVFVVDDSTKSISYFGKSLDVTRQEYLILATLIEHPERVFSRDQLLETAWDETGFCSSRTVDTYIKTIRSKLNKLNSATDPIITHRGFGYSLRKLS